MYIMLSTVPIRDTVQWYKNHTMLEAMNLKNHNWRPSLLCLPENSSLEISHFLLNFKNTGQKTSFISLPAPYWQEIATDTTSHTNFTVSSGLLVTIMFWIFRWHEWKMIKMNDLNTVIMANVKGCHMKMNEGTDKMVYCIDMKWGYTVTSQLMQ